MNRGMLICVSAFMVLFLGWGRSAQAGPSEDSPCWAAWKVGFLDGNVDLAETAIAEVNGQDDGYCSMVSAWVEIWHLRKEAGRLAIDDARRIFRQRGDILGETFLDVVIGRMSSISTSFDEPEAVYRRAQTIFEEAGDNFGLAFVWSFRGDAAYMQGRNAEAEEMYRRADTYCEKAGKPYMSGQIIVRLGDLAFRQGLNEKARALYISARNFFVTTDRKFGVGLVELRLCDLAIGQGRIAEAKESCQRALSSYEQFDEAIGQGSTWKKLGDIAFLQKLNVEAEACYRRAHDFFVRSNSSFGQASIWMGLAEIVRAEGKPVEAENLFREALSLFNKTHQPIGQGLVWFKLGQLRFDDKRYEEALSLNQVALNFHTETESVHALVADWFAQAQILEALGRIPEAVEAYEKAAELATRLVDASAGEASDRARYRELMQQYFESPIRLRLQLKLDSEDPDDESPHALSAFAVLEQSRSQGMMQRLKEFGVDLVTSLLPQGLRLEEERRDARIRELRKQSGKEGPGRDAALAELVSLEKERVDFAATLWESEKFRAYAAIKYPRNVEPKKLGLNADEVLVEFLSGDTGIYRWVVFRGKIRIFDRVSCRPRELDEKVALVRRHALEVVGPSASTDQSGVSTDDVVSEESWLYNELVADAMKYLPEGGRLVISPDGSLSTLPFEALVDGQGLALGLKVPILYTPSARSLELQRRQGSIGVAPERDLLALGDPVYDRGSDFRCGGRSDRCAEPKGVELKSVRKACQAMGVKVRKSLQARSVPAANLAGSTLFKQAPTSESIRDLVVRGGINERLCASRNEVTSVANLAGGWSSDVLLDLDASKAKLLDLLGMHGYRILHLSTHGVLPDGPICAAGGAPCITQPSLVLADASEEFEDCFLTAGEILEFFTSKEYRERKLVPPALVTLSACHSAEGDIIRGEGVQGMGQAFLYAGVRNVVMSLWAVGDDSSAEWMKVFYRAVKSGKDPATAAFEARRAIHDRKVQKDGQDWSRPFHWAPFIVTGMGETE